MWQTQKEQLEAGDDCWAIWGRGRKANSIHEYKAGSSLGRAFDVLQTRIDGKAGFHSKWVTKKILKQLDKINPDVVHLHNLHGYYLNIEMLFNWLAERDCQVKWTLHDCWAFTGHCAYFTYVKCAQWQTHCAYSDKCPQIDTYPKTISQASVKWNYENKHRLFTMLPSERMTIITPSKWLADLANQSFLSKYSIEVRYNTIDTTVFKPTPSDFRKRYALEDKFIILGVASTWSKRKGLDDFIRLAEELDDSYAVVLVGLNKKQIKAIARQLSRFSKGVKKKKQVVGYLSGDSFVISSWENVTDLVVSAIQENNIHALAGGGLDDDCGYNSKSAKANKQSFGSLNATTIQGCEKCSVILCGRTQSVEQLVAIYSSADLFFNPTKEDNYPTVNLEAEACGTPVLTYDTGGCRETIKLDLSTTIACDSSQAEAEANYTG